MSRRQHPSESTPPREPSHRPGRPSGRVYRYQPVGLDLWEGKGPAAGTRVVTVQPPGCPRNGTMGHAYIADADSGLFYGLRLLTSLERISNQTAAEATSPAAGRRAHAALRDGTRTERRS